MAYNREAYDKKYFTKQREEELARGSKVCNKCNQDLPLDEFHNLNKWGAKRPDCKACNKAHRLKMRRKDPRQALLNGSRARAKEHGLNFSLKKEDIVIPDRCPLLGIELSVGEGKLHDNSPTLDRLDNSEGYIPGNVIVVSYKANRIKSNATLEELSLLVENLALLN